MTPVFNAPVLPNQLPEQLRIGLVAGDGSGFGEKKAIELNDSSKK